MGPAMLSRLDADEARRPDAEAIASVAAVCCGPRTWERNFFPSSEMGLESSPEASELKLPRMSVEPEPVIMLNTRPRKFESPALLAREPRIVAELDCNPFWIADSDSPKREESERMT